MVLWMFDNSDVFELTFTSNTWIVSTFLDVKLFKRSFLPLNFLPEVRLWATISPCGSSLDSTKRCSTASDDFTSFLLYLSSSLPVLFISAGISEREVLSGNFFRTIHKSRIAKLFKQNVLFLDNCLVVVLHWKLRRISFVYFRNTLEMARNQSIRHEPPNRLSSLSLPCINMDDAGLVLFLCRGRDRAKIVCRNSSKSLAKFKEKV